MSRTPVLALASLGLLAACVQGPPPLSPTVSLESRICTAKPELGGAAPLALGDKDVTVTLDGDVACFKPPGGEKRVYSVFLLPPVAEPYIVSVTSTPRGRALFTPRLQLLDADGKVLREVGREAFLFHGVSLYAGLRSHDGEQYLLVMSDPQTTGQEESHIVDSTHVSTVASGGFVATVHTGSEQTNSYTYAHNGQITVAVRPVPKVN